jgi:hypothetical protein
MKFLLLLAENHFHLPSSEPLRVPTGTGRGPVVGTQIQQRDCQRGEKVGMRARNWLTCWNIELMGDLSVLVGESQNVAKEKKWNVDFTFGEDTRNFLALARP